MPMQSLIEKGPVITESPYKGQDRSEQDTKHVLRLEELMRSEDFVDIPLHSPHNSVQLFANANGHLKPSADLPISGQSLYFSSQLSVSKIIFRNECYMINAT